MILSHQTLVKRLPEIITEFWDVRLVNSASIDIRVGGALEEPEGAGIFNISSNTEKNPYFLAPGGFVLVATLERLTVPIDLAIDLRLKSTCARQGYNHSLAFWFDPGWDGIGTMEISNLNKNTYLPLYRGMRIAQIIVHKLDETCDAPYRGRYQGANSVEPPKRELNQLEMNY